jgi:hypothetical protein
MFAVDGFSRICFTTEYDSCSVTVKSDVRSGCAGCGAAAKLNEANNASVTVFIDIFFLLLKNKIN